jgi:hypothetical protein
MTTLRFSEDYTHNTFVSESLRFSNQLLPHTNE